MPTIPLKDYVYLGAIIVLLIAFGLFVHHERVIGEQKVEAADAKAVAAQVQRDETIQAAAAVATAINEGAYDHAITTPVAAVAPIQCLRLSAQRLGTVPAAAPGDQSGNTGALNGSANTPSAQTLPDLATILVQIGHDADAQILALQGDLAALRSEMESANVK